MQSLRYAHGSGASVAPWEEIVDDVERSEAIASIRAFSRELTGSIYSTVARGSVLLAPPRGLGVE